MLFSFRVTMNAFFRRIIQSFLQIGARNMHYFIEVIKSIFSVLLKKARLKVPADKFYTIEKPKRTENELATALVKEYLLNNPSLSKKINKYRAPVFDYGHFGIPSDN